MAAASSERGNISHSKGSGNLQVRASFDIHTVERLQTTHDKNPGFILPSGITSTPTELRRGLIVKTCSTDANVIKSDASAK